MVESRSYLRLICPSFCIWRFERVQRFSLVGKLD